ncbi:MAG TPA: hypothetical protein VG943_02250 [Caulobacterales bacterium]|nr:hypothetical protein [Caulobacterales bacterium]
MRIVLPKFRRGRAKPTSVRLLPAAMVSVAAVLGLKAVAVAEGVAAETASPPPADAQASAPPADGAPAANADAQQQPACAAPSFADQAGLSQSEVQVLQALQARREALDSRAAEIDTRGQLLTAAEQRLDQRLAELHRLETTVNGLLGQLDQAQEQRLAGLVDVYQRMRSKDAATVFDGLDDGVLVQVASRMRQQNLAEIMGHMQPTRARALTQMLAALSRPPTSGQALLDQSAANTTPSGAPR